MFGLTVYQIFRYHEKPFAQKLDILYQRNLYVLAINLAQKAGLDSAQQNVILRKFGDYLYQKQDYDTAMQQYLKAIDNTEPSQVIRKVFSFFVSGSHSLICSSFLIPSEYITSLSIWRNSTNITKRLRIIPLSF